MRRIRLRWVSGALLLALLAWQGHRLAAWLPRFEQGIESLGPWGPVAFVVAVVLLEPLLLPDSLFGLTAGAVFGLAAGTLYYFVAVYAMCLWVHWLGGHWLRARVLRLLASRPQVDAAVRAATSGGVRFALLARLVPLNPAAVGYALGAAGVPLRTAAIANVAMFTHLFPAVYLGAAAAHVTEMAARGHAEWEVEGLVLLLGLGACAWLGWQVTRRAMAMIESERVEAAGRGEPRPVVDHERNTRR